MSTERLQKILARAGVASRRKAEELIRAGRVTVDGEVAQIGAKADADQDAIRVDGKALGPPPPPRYLLLNKPKGYMTTRSDPEGRKTVLDLIAPKHRANVVPVGRLDYQSEGLLILTNDGELAQRVAHPRYGCKKTYLAKVKGRPGPDALRRLGRGMVLDGHKTGPATVEPAPSKRGHRRPQGNTWWTVEIAEGRTRQIREMFFRVGHSVQRLQRVAIGPVADPKLPIGSYRELTPDEVRSLKG